MAKIKVIYDCEEELSDISKQIESLVEEKAKFSSNISSDHINNIIRNLIQESFDMGRKFEKLGGNNTMISEAK